MTERGGGRPGTDLVVVGDCNPDVLVLGADVTPSFGQQEKLVDGISMVVGGSAAITAVAAARLGLSVELVAAIGADPAGDFMLGQLSREGVGTAAVAVRDGVPT
ncbi:MAG TPA: PfkB family carbohydrate kinase, partial [Streptosporangiaceae bacterium]|nr:PfkB family carbohydrate kinase [Streptosporangiaceae bacterium]